jgi:hypothetical protein
MGDAPYDRYDPFLAALQIEQPRGQSWLTRAGRRGHWHDSPRTPRRNPRYSRTCEPYQSGAALARECLEARPVPSLASASNTWWRRSRRMRPTVARAASCNRLPLPCPLRTCGSSPATIVGCPRDARAVSSPRGMPPRSNAVEKPASAACPIGASLLQRLSWPRPRARGGAAARGAIRRLPGAPATTPGGEAARRHRSPPDG